jgi:toxin ParE1/3/4
MYRYIRLPIRRHFSTTFPYGILFEDRPDHVRIVAVMALHRDPEYWLHRLSN